MALAARNGWQDAGARAAAAALVALTLDLLMEPVAVRSGLWRWTPPGPWLGVPIGNFVGWAVIVAGYALGAERFGGVGSPAREAAIRVVVIAGSILALVVVGLAWRMLGLERLFTGARGWLAWAALLVAAVAVPRARADAVQGAGLAARLGRAVGWRPAAVFLGVGTVFAIDAALLRDARLGLVALASLLALARISGRASSGS
jgi:uncharacterized membrane protein